MFIFRIKAATGIGVFGSQRYQRVLIAGEISFNFKFKYFLLCEI
jgi:hypothetical protein